MARVQATSESFRIATQRTLEATQKLLVKVAKREHNRVLNTDPRPVSFTRIVDGRVGSAEETVKANGVIVYQYPRLEQVVQFAMETLFDLSPVLSGEYRNAHTLFVNGAAASDLRGWQPGQEIVITNPLPYARKIESGKMSMRVSGSDRVYQQALKIVRGRYGNMASVSFTYRGIVGGAQINQGKAASTGKSWWLGNDGVARAASGVLESAIAKKHGKTAHNRSEVRFPVLLIREL